MIKKIGKITVVFILNALARAILFKYKPRIVAITGGVGKTSTKDAVYAVFSEFYYAGRSIKSYNSEIGLPLAIIGGTSGWGSPLAWLRTIFDGLTLIVFKTHYPKWLILEVGVDRPRDMERAVRLLKSDIVIITKLPDTPPHVEFFKSAEELHDEKWKLVKSLKQGGTLVVNSDDANIARRLSETGGRKVITYGFNEDAMVRASNDHVMYEKRDGGKFPDGVTFKVDNAGGSVPVMLYGTLGRGQVLSALSALSAGTALDLNIVKMAEALAEYESPPGRLKLLRGINNSLIIDDTYNASPEAAQLALGILYGLECSGKKIVVLGDMLELGKETIPAHEKVGEHVPANVSTLYLVGQRAKHIATGVSKKGITKDKIKFYEKAEQGVKHLVKKIGTGDIILVKGSQGIRLEKLVAEIIVDKDKKEKLLVRQGLEWMNR